MHGGGGDALSEVLTRASSGPHPATASTSVGEVMSKQGSAVVPMQQLYPTTPPNYMPGNEAERILGLQVCMTPRCDDVILEH